MEDTNQLNIHNVKFYHLAPRSIQSMAYNRQTSKLALTRSDASIEIWDMQNSPFMERSIMGNAVESIEAVCWIGEELLTAGLTGEIVHWDLMKLQPKARINVTGSSVWCMDVFGHRMAAGTEEGYLNICELEPDLNSLRYVKIMDKQDGRILCCKFDKAGKHIVTGSSDIIRIWDVSSGHVIHRLTTGRSESKKETVIWSILVLDGLQIVSADSRGKITFWDGQCGAQVESYQCLKGDALCLAVDEKEENIFVAGTEPTICSYALTNTKKELSHMKKWVRTTSYYVHTHDIKALIIEEKRLFSGGVDGCLCVTSFLSKFCSRYGPLLNPPSAALADNGFLLLKQLNHVELWQMNAVPKSSDLVRMEPLGPTRKEYPVKLLELLGRKKQPIICANISHNGKWLTYSTASHIGLFNLRLITANKIELHPINTKLEHFSPANLALFSPTSSHLFLYKPTANVISIFEPLESTEEVDFKQNISLKKYTSDLVHLMEMSKCEKYLVIASLCKNLIVFFRHEKKIGDRIVMEWRHRVNLPTYTYPIATLTIHSQFTDRLAALYTDGKLIEYNMDKLEIVYSSVVSDFQCHSPQQIMYDPRADNRMLLLTEKSLFHITTTNACDNAVTDIKRKKGSSPSMLRNINSNVIREANHFVFTGWLDDRQLVTVEVNSKVFLEQLPPVLRVKKYGCS